MFRHRPWVAPALSAWVLSWPAPYPAPAGDLDPSHEAAMHLAAEGGLRFGHDLVFSYGPLGFLTSPTTYTGPTYVAAFVFLHAVRFAALALVARAVQERAAGRRGASWMTAAVTYLVAVVALPYLGVAELAAMTLAYAVIRSGFDASRWPLALVLALAASLSGVLLLVKFNAAVIAGVATAAAATAWVVGRRDHPARLAVAVVAGGLAGFGAPWLLAGQRVTDVPAYLLGSVEIASGYAGAMAYEDPGRGWEYLAAALFLGCVGWSVRLLFGAGERVRQGALTAALVTLPTLYLAFRSGFVRHDSHSLIFFGAVLLWLLVVPQRSSLRFQAATGLCLVVVLLAAAPGGARQLLPMSADPVAAQHAASAVGALLPENRSVLNDAARRHLRGQYGLRSSTIDRLRGRAVHVDPWETTLIWAYPEIDWGPVPVFQAYAAFTERLDALNAERLADEGGPEFVVRRLEAIDHRNPRWESPAYQLALACRYREVEVDGDWQVLARSRDRCGPAEPLGTVTAPLETAVEVPSPRQDAILVAAVVDIGMGPLARIRGLLFKPPPTYATVVNERGDIVEHRFIAGHAGAPHVLAIPDCHDWSAPDFDLPAYTSFALRVGFEPQEQARHYVTEFSAVAFECR